MIRHAAWRLFFLMVLATCGGAAQAGDPVDVPFGPGTFEYYGQLSPAHLTFDDGVQKSNDVVDNSNSNSRIGMWFRRPLHWGRFNFNFETALGFPGSSLANQADIAGKWDWTEANIRKFEVIWETDRFGTLYIGQGSMVRVVLL